jgi:hypothetical protein
MARFLLRSKTNGEIAMQRHVVREEAQADLTLYYTERTNPGGGTDCLYGLASERLIPPHLVPQDPTDAQAWLRAFDLCVDHFKGVKRS